jgi:hypothetical protein
MRRIHWVKTCMVSGKIQPTGGTANDFYPLLKMFNPYCLRFWNSTFSVYFIG